jgi:tetratricopeptide (TPR) repeat protein
LIWSGAREPSLKAIQLAADAQRWGDVEAQLRRWLRRYPRDGNAWEMLGGLFFEQGRTGEAREALDRVREADPGWMHAQVVLAEIAVRERSLAAAERILRRAAARDRRAIEPRLRLVSLLVLESRPAEAWSALRELFAITRDPRHLADSILISQIESDIRDLSPEIEEFLARTPDDPWLRRAWGLFLVLRGRPAEALPHLKATAAAFDDDPLARFALAECQMRLGVTVQDVSILGNPPAGPVDAARYWVLRSRLLEVLGRDKELLENLQKAVTCDPRNAEAHYRLGRVMLRRGDRPGAQIHLDRALALGVLEDRLRRELRSLVRPTPDATAFLRMGRLCRESAMIAEAREWIGLALERDPRNRVLQAELAQLSVIDEGPAVSLSRPVLKNPVQRQPAGNRASLGARPAAVARFEDITERAGVRYRYDCGATSNLYIGDTMGGGVALFDFDDDGWLDIYFINGCPLPFDRQFPPRPNKLFRNRGDGTFEDVTARAGVAGRGYGMGCAVGDFDNDGHDDLFVTGLNQTVLYRNRGNGTFEDVTARARVASSRWTTAAGFGDFDGDGDVDLMVVTYVQADPENVPECRDKFDRLIHCQPERFPAQLDLLFRNNGDGTFTDITREAGIEVPEGKGLGLAVADLDGDGRLDLFVANDGTPNFLFRNCGGLKFEEIGRAAGVAYDGMGRATASMGVVAADLNGDGRIDLFHTNFINQTNTLRWNVGGGLFVDGTLAANLASPSRAMTGFGTVALDVDNNGSLDLFVANGHTDDQPWFNTPMAQVPQLFLALEGGRFDCAGIEVSPYFSRTVVGRGVAAGDLDNDGRVDLVVVHRDAPAALLRNVTPGGHWLALRLRGSRSGRTPVGARVTCRAAGRSQVRCMTSGTSYLSASDSRIDFGLGNATVADHLEVRWPSGMVQSWSNVELDRTLEVQEGHGELEAIDASPQGRSAAHVAVPRAPIDHRPTGRGSERSPDLK